MTRKQEIQEWLKAGAEINTGLRLFSNNGGCRYLHQLVSNNSAYKKYLINALIRMVGVSIEITPPPATAPKPKLREEWPFLKETGCPPELKILAADKITAYHNYVEAHEELFDCIDVKECYEVAKTVIENFSENRNIYEEFRHYQEHHSVLGTHNIFSKLQELAALRKMSIVQLLKKRKQLEHNIWRTQDELRKNDKPHLRADREARLLEKNEELAEVNRLIETYE